MTRCRAMCSDDSYSQWRCDNALPCAKHSHITITTERLPVDTQGRSGKIKSETTLTAVLYEFDNKLPKATMPRERPIEVRVKDGEVVFSFAEVPQFDYVIPADLIDELYDVRP